MSAAWVTVADERRTLAQEQASSERRVLHSITKWNPEDFAREQIRRLVGHVFQASAQNPARQVVFSAIDPENDISGICMQVGEVLALESQADVAVVAESSSTPGEAGHNHGGDYLPGGGCTVLRETAIQRGRNLWLLPSLEDVNRDRGAVFLHAHLGQIRREFEYSIVQGPSTGQSNGAIAMAQFADGIILVISAQRTRRAAALKVKQAVDEVGARLLGAVLSDREFPIPEAVYRRL